MNAAAREQWLAERATGIGGSDAAKAAGLSQWGTPYELYREKVERIRKPETPAMRRGTLLEPAVRQMYADHTQREVITPAGILRHPRYPWALANVDGIAAGEIVVDFKTTGRRTGWGQPGTADVPIDYLCQVQHYMVVTGLERAELAVLFPDFELAIYPVPADRELQAMLMAAEREFWDRVLRRDPPPPSTPADVLARYPQAEAADIAVQADAATLAAWERLRALREQIDELADEAEHYETQIKTAIAAADTLRDGRRTLATWRNAAAPVRFDAAAFACDHPDLYDHYLRDGKPSRRFLLKT